MAVLAVLVTAPSVAWANGSDAFSGRTPITTGTISGVDVTSFGIEASEPHTPNSSSWCIFPTYTSTMWKTAWYTFTATGPSTTVDTFQTGGQIDTALGVYTGTAVNALSFTACQDNYDTNGTPDTSDDDGSDLLTFATTKGTTYALQIGVYCGPSGTTEANCDSGLPGRQFGMSIGPPGNDLVADAAAIAVDESRSTGNAFAGHEAGEPLDCAGTAYDSTEWFTVAVTKRGRLTFTATGLGTAQTVVSLFPADRSSRLACGQGAAAADVAPGAYLAQVGTVGGFQEDFTVLPTFEASSDQDGDGSSPPADCNDADPAIPGPEVVNNGVDENCDGIAARDADGDGALAPPAGSDCRDDDPSIKPTATEIAGDGIDQNCDGADAPKPPSPDRDGDGVIDASDCAPANPAIHPGAKDRPGNRIDEDCSGADARYRLVSGLVAVRFRIVGSRLRITLLRVRGAADPGSRAEVRCRGRGCPFARRAVKLTGGRAVATKLLAGRLLRRGAVVELRLTAPDMIGKVNRVTVTRAGRQDTLCLTPGVARLRRC